MDEEELPAGNEIPRACLSYAAAGQHLQLYLFRIRRLRQNFRLPRDVAGKGKDRELQSLKAGVVWSGVGAVRCRSIEMGTVYLYLCIFRGSFVMGIREKFFRSPESYGAGAQSRHIEAMGRRWGRVENAELGRDEKNFSTCSYSIGIVTISWHSIGNPPPR
jgi:hypothetical protein